jgi:L-lactate dehydrogenase complex protein LldF
VQLRHEPPSHIVMPAIHLKKEEIGDLFHRELGTDAGASDPAYLTEAARTNLRRRFLEAQAGLTGVNFAVAESGGVVVCTNEGNADMGTTLPPLHIACMGVEKLIPRRRDLAVFLRLLARSATGQPVTVYTTHFHGPRPGGELHIIMVDNGRSAQLASESFRRSLSCIRCGACLNTCPVYRRSGGHSYDWIVPGPIGIVLAPGRDAAKHRSLPMASSLCGSCSDVCPVRIDLHHEILAWRAEMSRRGLLSRGKRAGMVLLGHVLRRGFLYRAAGWFLRRVGSRLPRRLLYGRWNVWGRQRELPPMPRRSFRQLYRERR